MKQEQQPAAPTGADDTKKKSPSGESAPGPGYVKDLEKKVKQLEDTEKALLNVLEDARILENQLRGQTEELEKFHMAAEESFDHMVITDKDGVVLYANPAVEKITGFKNSEVIGHTPALWGKQMGKEFYEKFWHTIKDLKRKFYGEVANKRKDGKRYIAEIGVAPLLDDQGEVKFFVGVERDITEQRKYEERLIAQAKDLDAINRTLQEEKEREESILQFLRSIGDGVVAVDPDGVILFTNEMAEKLLLAEGKLLKGVKCETVFSLASEKQPETGVDFLAGIFSGKAVIEDFSGLLKRSDGTRIPVAYTASPILGKEDQLIGCMVAFKDVTEEREIDRVKDRFLSVAAHQLRTPLSGMRWNMEMLLGGDYGELPVEAREAVSRIHENNQRMIVLVNDLLNVALLNEGPGPDARVAVDVATVVSAVIKELAPYAEKSHIAVDFSLPPGGGCQAFAVERRLYEVFMNIIHNAIKYSRPNTRVSVVIEPCGRGVFSIKISDSGIGIPKGEQDKVFGKFFRASNALQWKTEGSGLGLSVVKAFVEEMSGSIRFETKEGEGTTFFVELPVAKKSQSKLKVKPNK